MREQENATTAAPALPSGWRWATIGEVSTRIDYGFTASANTKIDEPKFLRITDIRNGTVDWSTVPGCEIPTRDEREKCLRIGDLMIARTGSVGNSFLITQVPRAVFASYLLRIRLVSEVLPEYVYAFTKSEMYWEQIRQAARGGIQSNINTRTLGAIRLPIPPLEEQRSIADALTVQMAAVERARAAVGAQKALVGDYVEACLQQSLTEQTPIMLALADALTEISRGVGPSWKEYELLGATRAGIAPAKEGVGKSPERYKRVDAATVFYNPMRILLGSIAMVDEGENGGITSPDYVALKTKPGVLHHRWFYYWMRSSYGEHFIKTLTRGAVRERILFRRLMTATIEVPQWDEQLRCSEQLRAVPKLKQTMNEQQQLLDELVPTLLQQAFSGALSACRPSAPVPETLEDKQERMAVVIALLLDECRQQGRVPGRTLASKCLYLAAAHAGVPLGVPFQRWQYGPYYSGIREVEAVAAAREWFTVRPQQWGYEYVPGTALADALTLAPPIVRGRAGTMQDMLALLASLDAAGAEAVGTLYGAWNDFLLDGEQPTGDTIIREVRENWHPEKAKIPVQTWEHWLHWMHEHKLTPRGTEPHTIHTMRGQRG